MNGLNERKFVWFWHKHTRYDARRARKFARRMIKVGETLEQSHMFHQLKMDKVYRDVARNCYKIRYMRVRKLRPSGKVGALAVVLRNCKDNVEVD